VSAGKPVALLTWSGIEPISGVLTVPHISPSESLYDVEAIAETDLALLCLIDDQEIWVPKSQITDDSEVKEEGDAGILTVTAWFTKRSGLLRRRGYAS
jgi:hypothetical protein